MTKWICIYCKDIIDDEITSIPKHLKDECIKKEIEND